MDNGNLSSVSEVDGSALDAFLGEDDSRTGVDAYSYLRGLNYRADVASKYVREGLDLDLTDDQVVAYDAPDAAASAALASADVAADAPASSDADNGATVVASADAPVSDASGVAAGEEDDDADEGDDGDDGDDEADVDAPVEAAAQGVAEVALGGDDSANNTGENA